MSINKMGLYLLTEYPRDAVRALEQFEPEQLAEYLDVVPINTVAEVIKLMVPSIAVDVLKCMRIEKSSKIVMQLGVERGSLLLQRMSRGIRLDFVSRMSPVFANMMKLVLRYPAGTVGQAMNPNVLTVQEDLTVEEVLHVIRNSAEILQDEIYIVDNKQLLVGQVAAKQLLITAPDKKMKKIMSMPPHRLAARANVKSVKNISDWQMRDNFPVTDHHGVFIGVLDRAAIKESMHIKSKSSEESEITGTALAVAELFWDACADLMVPNQVLSNKGKRNE